MFSAEPLPLMDLCRRVIRQQVTKERIEQGKIEDLNLPKSIKDYLAYKDRVKATVNGSASPADASGAETATANGHLNDDEDMDDDLSEERRWGSANATRATKTTSVAASSN